jgi:hypothetical protein
VGSKDALNLISWAESGLSCLRRSPGIGGFSIPAHRTVSAWPAVSHIVLLPTEASPLLAEETASTIRRDSRWFCMASGIAV